MVTGGAGLAGFSALITNPIPSAAGEVVVSYWYSVKVSSRPDDAGRLRLLKTPPTTPPVAEVSRSAPLPEGSGVVRPQPGIGVCERLVPAVMQATLGLPLIDGGSDTDAVVVLFWNDSFNKVVAPARVGDPKAVIKVVTKSTPPIATVHLRTSVPLPFSGSTAVTTGSTTAPVRDSNLERRVQANRCPFKLSNSARYRFRKRVIQWGHTDARTLYGRNRTSGAAPSTPLKSVPKCAGPTARRRGSDQGGEGAHPATLPALCRKHWDAKWFIRVLGDLGQGKGGGRRAFGDTWPTLEVDSSPDE